MFDVGLSELLVIGVVALLVLGPERLPLAARTVGALLRKARASFEAVKNEVERELHDEELKRALKEVAQPGEAMRELTQPIDEASAELRAQVKDINDASR